MAQPASEVMSEIRAQLAPFLDGKGNPNRQASIATVLYVTLQLVSLFVFWVATKVVNAYFDAQSDPENLFDVASGFRMAASAGALLIVFAVAFVFVFFWMIFGCSWLAARPLRKQGVEGVRAATWVAPLPGIVGFCFGPLALVGYPLYWLIFRAFIKQSDTLEPAPGYYPTAPQPSATAAPEYAAEPLISEDGHWVWDGTTWQPNTSPAHPLEHTPEPAVLQEESTTERTLSDDGHWVWDGITWQPNTSPALTLEPAVAQEESTTERTVSEDGHWVWDGTTWQPNTER